MRLKKVVFVLLLVLSAAAGFSAPSSDGMYATLQTTMGDVCFELYYTNVPRTVANFVSLAEGTRPWLDPRDGFISNDPYYNGIIFHRAESNFVIQCGSPKGTGKDGPGYFFNTEIDPALRHDRYGIVAMANSGENRNGGQIYFTVKPEPGLDDRYSVFGLVTEGMEVVSNIAAVAVDGKNKPLADVTITNTFITRNGTNALAFDPAGVVPVLPMVRPATNHIYESSGMWLLDWEEHAGGTYWLFATDDLVTAEWGDLLGYPVHWPAADITGIFNSNPKAFFNITEILSAE